MSQYQTGTVSANTGNATVVGTDTLWTANVANGDLFVVVGGTVVYEVANVVSNTEISLSAPWATANISGQNYAITRDFTPNGIPYITKGDVETALILKRAFMLLDPLV